MLRLCNVMVVGVCYGARLRGAGSPFAACALLPRKGFTVGLIRAKDSISALPAASPHGPRVARHVQHAAPGPRAARATRRKPRPARNAWGTRRRRAPYGHPQGHPSKLSPAVSVGIAGRKSGLFLCDILGYAILLLSSSHNGRGIL